MTGQKDFPRVPNPPAGDGHHVTYRYMTATELADQDGRQNKYDAMLARQEAFERSREVATNKPEPVRAGCTFAKSCKLPDAIIDYAIPSGMVPTDSLKDYGEVAWLGAREVDDAGLLNLETISGSTVSLEIGRLALRAPALALPTITALGAGGVALLSGLVAALWTPTLGDSALYTEDQLRVLKQARTRVRLHVEQQADGSLKGYGFYTGKNRDWEMVDVAQFAARGNRFVADLGEGIELIWTPAVDGSDILGIPALEAAPQAPHIWVYPPTKAADGILVNPVYPPEYRDFILVFPAGSGVKPVYIVLNVRGHGTAKAGHTYHSPPETDEITAFPGLKRAKKKTPYSGGLRDRWTDAKGRTIYEWDFLHGELEAYRASDGTHLGSYDHRTGKQLDPPKGKKRSIKKYL
ncbi:MULTISPECIES: S-type pyocin domain-containing protein [unclassified Pseudomonas]|uniref:S-type pyocin domain-containing protein n=1 Tax=unclassified Pseudomonas TaxID=196821 RepID=UPI000A1E75CD|nr:MULTISPECIES: S-type pyocin domain-containing protein [unclassified Pseudomonas]MDI2144024.1 S-type pyocin domain-containing protein [Pseudomonas sp. ITA]